MVGVGDHIFCGRNPSNAVLRGLHLLLRAQQPKREDHQPAHLIVYLLSINIAISKTPGVDVDRRGWKVKFLGWGWDDGKGVGF